MRTFKNIALSLLLLFMLYTIVRSAVADDPTIPREGDIEASKRQLSGDALKVRRPAGQWIGGLGIVEPASPIRTLAPASAGRIAQVLVAEGDRVEAGAILVELDSDAQLADLAAAEAQVDAAALQLQRTQGATTTSELQATERDAEAARVRAERSATSRDRLQQTLEAGAVSVDALDAAVRQAETDRLAAEAAARRFQSATSGRSIDSRRAAAELAAARARRDGAVAALENRRIRAPLGGEILEILFQTGEYVQPGGVEPVIVMGDTSTLRARVDVDERDVGRVIVGAPVLVQADALPDRRFQGTVVSIGRRMGRKNIRTNEPTERVDTKILEVVVELGAVEELVVGQRLMAYIQR